MYTRSEKLARRRPPFGVLLMAYGTPGNIRDVKKYLAEIRGKVSSAARVRELRERYRRIGGSTPLLRITRAQARALERMLGPRYKVFVGMKHWSPFIRDAVRDMRAFGIRRSIAIALAPHYSATSIGGYRKCVDDACAGQEGPTIDFVKSWHREGDLIRCISLQLKVAIRTFPRNAARGHVQWPFVIFTAHSLPQHSLVSNDPYERELMTTSRLVAKQLGIARWSFAFQSRSGPRNRWIGPDILDEITMRAKEGEKNFILCPVGFVSDHLEILYDLDIECARHARSLGVTLRRTESRNTHPLFIRALYRLVRRELRSRRS